MFHLQKFGTKHRFHLRDAGGEALDMLDEPVQPLVVFVNNLLHVGNRCVIVSHVLLGSTEVCFNSGKCLRLVTACILNGDEASCQISDAVFKVFGGCISFAPVFIS